MSTAHPGFAAVQAKIARKEGVSMNRAGAILGSRTRKASAAARRRNPRLNRVKGGRKMAKGGWMKCKACGEWHKSCMCEGGMVTK